MARRGKRRSRPFERQSIKGRWITLLVVAGILGISNWYVHQPRVFREKTNTPLAAPLISIVESLGNMTAVYTDDWGWTGCDMTVSFTSEAPLKSDVFGGYPVAVPGKDAPKDIIVLHKEGFTVGYSPSLKHPVWAAYRIDPTEDKSSPKRPGRFSSDPKVRSPDHDAYTGSGYDRGHMVPNYAIASRLGKRAQEQTFLTSNISPQSPELNQHAWRDVEHRLSDPLSDAYGPIWVIVGAHSESNGKRLKSGIDVPFGFYQIAVTVDNGQLRGFALYMPQQTARNAPSRGAFISVRVLEEMTGLNFFPALDPALQETFEAQESSRFWPTVFRKKVLLNK